MLSNFMTAIFFSYRIFPMVKVTFLYESFIFITFLGTYEKFLGSAMF